MVNIKNELENTFDEAEDMRFNDLDVDPQAIRAIMINEIVPSDPKQDFYGGGNP
ncbi:hypothetical protein ACF3MZ_02260 [Paenibacillaceae bacterium WGS1546]|uniref:hypothetical protein n=1 Tax=Cohnella sp. WGS1546 TaxID=3366810 RepID=UPI00372D3E1C